MMQRKRVYWLLVFGTVVVVCAWAVRLQVQVRRPFRVVSAPDTRRADAEKELLRLRKAVEAAPKDTDRRWALVEFYNRYGLLDRAGEQIVVLLKLNPKDIRAHLALADALLAKKRFVLSEASYRDVVAMDPKSVVGWQGLAAALIKEGRYLEANFTAQHAFDLNSKDPNSHLLLAMSALEYADQFPDPTAHAGELEFARRELEVMKTVAPDNPDVYYALGRAYEGLRNRQGAIANLERAHALRPDRQDVCQLLAVAYRADNNRPAAQKLLEDLTARTPGSARTYDLLGQIYQASAQPDAAQKALLAFQKANELVPGDPVFQEHLGAAYYQVGELKQARSHFESVTRLDPNHSYAFQQLALIYTRLGQTQLAATAAGIARATTFNQQQLTQIQELSKKHPESVNLHLLLAKRYTDLHMLGPSRDEYIEILQLDPKNSQVPPQIRNALKATATPPKR
jgi:tetratricopeptide (TPR) repeat protein